MSAFDGKHWDGLGVGRGACGTCRTYPEPEEVVATEREGEGAVGADPRERLAAEHVPQAPSGVFRDIQGCGNRMLGQVENAEDGFGILAFRIVLPEITHVGENHLVVRR